MFTFGFSDYVLFLTLGAVDFSPKTFCPYWVGCVDTQFPNSSLSPAALLHSRTLSRLCFLLPGSLSTASLIWFFLRSWSGVRLCPSHPGLNSLGSVAPPPCLPFRYKSIIMVSLGAPIPLISLQFNPMTPPQVFFLVLASADRWILYNPRL